MTFLNDYRSWKVERSLALWIPLNLLCIFSESEGQIKWLNKGVLRVIITKPILKSSWGLFFTNGSFGKNGWLLFIITAIPLSPINVSFQSPSSQNVAIVKVLSPVYTQLTWTSESVGTWRFCFIGLQASWQGCICICASVCVSVCPIYGGNLLALWTSPTCAAVETLIQATNNSNFQVGNQQTRNCALYMV